MHIRLLATLFAALTFPAVASAAPSEEHRTQILVVCAHGNVKSLMAASYFNRLAAARKLPYRAVSRGSAPDSTTVPPSIVSGLREEGFDVAAFRPVAVDDEDIAASAHLVLINTDLPSGTRAHGIPTERWTDVPPASVDYGAARDRLKAHVELLIDTLVARDGK